MTLQVQNFLFAYLLPNVLAPLVIALVAILGVARWRRTLLALAIAELVSFVVGVLTLRVFAFSAIFGAVNSLPLPVFEFFQSLGAPLINISITITWIGALLALTLSARAHSWGWFVALLLASIISVLAIEFAFSPYGLIVLYGSSRAGEIFAETPYIIITNSLAGLTMLVQLLYAIFGRREPEQPGVTPSAMPASANEATLP